LTFYDNLRFLNHWTSRQNVADCCGQRGVGLWGLQEGINPGKVVRIWYNLAEAIGNGVKANAVQDLPVLLSSLSSIQYMEH
jgi:hypothetical protein